MDDKTKKISDKLMEAWTKEPRPVDRIDVMLNHLRKYWINNQDLRLGQLIYNIGHEARPDGLDLFFIEDTLMGNKLKNHTDNINDYSYITKTLYSYKPNSNTVYTDEQLDGIAFKIAKDYKENSEVILDEYLNSVSFSVFNLSIKDSVSVYGKVIKLIDGDTLIKLRDELTDKTINKECDYEIIN